jgi:hypothetical protein
MLIPKINIGKLLDPVKVQQVIKYQGNLTVTSNDTNVIPRDAAGNVQLQEDSESNPLLIIEPVATKITLNSVLKVLDTRFQYFKFPATTRVIDDTPVDIDLSIPELDAPVLDPIYARYKPSEDRRILTGDTTKPGNERFSGILIDEVVDGLPQQNPNGYFITKDIKSSGKDLRFKIKLQHKYQSTTKGYGTSYFSLILNSPDRGLIRKWKGEFANTSISNPTLFGSIYQYEIQNLEFEIIIENSEFEIGETISIGAFAGQNVDEAYHFIIADQTYWSITDASKNVDEWNQELQMPSQMIPDKIEKLANVKTI